MARIRTIKPEFPQSQSMGRVSRDARLLFVLLWTIADDSGRTRAASRMLASLLFPYDDDAPKRIEGWLGELERENCVALYRVNGDDYLEVCNWSQHQKIDRASPSKFPGREDAREDSSSPREESPLDQGPRTKDQGPAARPRGEVDPVFVRFWEAYGKKVGRLDAEKAWRKLAPDSELGERIVEAAKTAERMKPDKQFRKDPSGWLNGRHWEDEVIAPSSGGSLAPRLVATSTQHIPNMPLGHANCSCDGCVSFRAKRAAQ